MSERSRGIITAATGPFRTVLGAVADLAAPTARRWWNNPLLRHTRRARPLPLGVLRRVAPWAAALLAVLAVAAWVLVEQPAGRAAGAVLMGVSLAAVLLPLAVTGPVAARLTVREARAALRDPYLLADIGPEVFTWGLALNAMWRLRWLVIGGLVLTPALMVGVLRLDVASFAAWRDSAAALRGATAASRAVWLLPGGGIPVFRIALRALSAGLLPWVALPFAATLGVAAGLWLPDASMGPLLALLTVFGLGAAVMIAWHYLTLMPLLSGPGEVLRLAAVVMLLVLLGKAASWVNRYSAGLLAPGVEA